MYSMNVFQMSYLRNINKPGRSMRYSDGPSNVSVYDGFFLPPDVHLASYDIRNRGMLHHCILLHISGIQDREHNSGYIENLKTQSE